MSRIRIVALALTVLTGFSGLVYEVAWQKYLATLLGSHSEATAAVLGLFLGGLAVGYALFGALSRRLVERARAAGRPPRLLLTYGGLEAGIGVYALLFPLLFRAATSVSFLLPHGNAGVGFAFDVALAALLIGPPAVLMGGTIPFLTQALARGLADATRFHALVYALNTAGAFAGALAAGFWLVPALGLVGVLVAMGIVNLAAGACFLLLGHRGAPDLLEAPPLAERSEARSEPQASGVHPGLAERSEARSEPQASGVRPGLAERSEARSEAVQIPGFARYAAVALLVGFAMMSIQTVLIRLGGLSFGASQFTFSMVVAVFVLCIALGSLAVSAFSRIPPLLLALDLWGLALALYLLYRPLQDSPYWAHVLRSLFRDQDAAFYPYQAAAFLGLLAVIGPPVVLSGAALPLLFHHLRHQVGDLGDVAGRLYSWNTVGALLGALLGGYALLYWIELHHVYRLALAAIVLGAVLVTDRLYPLGKPLAAAFLLVPLAHFALLPAWAPDRLSVGLFRTRQPLPNTYAGPDVLFARHNAPRRNVFYDDDPTSSVTVLEQTLDDGRLTRSIVTNGKSDGSLVTDYMTMALAALLPALLAEKVERAFVIGYGTGVTAGELAALKDVREVVVAEISPGVIEAAPLFDLGNLDASHHPAVHIEQADAYRALLRSEGRFDVIASEPSNPWVMGTEMLFSREFLEAARDRLAPGGVYAQWFHLYETDDATVALVMRTYASVFEHVAVWYALGDDLLLLGLREPEAALDLERLERRVARPDFAAGLRRTGIGDLSQLLAHELLPLGVVHALELEGPVHTLLHPRLSHMAARAFFRGRYGELPPSAGLGPARVGYRNSLLRRYLAREGPLSDEAHARLARHTCRLRGTECVTLLARWRREVPSSERRRRIEEEIRKSARLMERTPLSQVPRVSQLYAGDPDGTDARDPLDLAKQATARFVRFYHHGTPFPRSGLAEAWRRCDGEGPTRQRCRETRAAVEARLGDLDAPLLSATPSLHPGG